MHAKNVGLVAHHEKPRAAELAATLIEEFEGKDVAVRLDAATAALVGGESKLNVAELGASTDVIVVLGGDGTMLRVVHELGRQSTPLFGINLGSLGFLTCVSSENYCEAVSSIVTGDYQISLRTVLSVRVTRQEIQVAQEDALNEVVIGRGERSHLVKMEAFIDGVELTEYNADGLIVAPATGSTAYSLSAGGPILMPGSGVFIIQPICPHVLTNRPLIVADTSTLQVHPAKGQSDLFLTVDGHKLHHLAEGDRIEISKAPHQVRLAMLPHMTFASVLRQKLKWSGSNI